MNQVIHDLLPSWIPALILFEDHRGYWNLYIEAIYKRYLQDFVERKTFFQRVPIFVRFEPSYQLKGATFWHLISEGEAESDRLPDLRRCERIGWPRSIIENSFYESEVAIWESTRPWKGQQQKRFNLVLKDFSYLVVLAIRSKDRMDLITAFPIERTHEREKKRKEYENFLRTKKEGAAI
jgi:hypothetical protein